MEAQLERLVRSLVLTEEEEGELILSQEVWKGDETVEGFLVVGRLLTPRPYRFDVLRMTFMNILRSIRGLELKLLTANRFMIRFNHVADRDKAINGCPWIFDRNLIILTHTTAEEDPLKVDLSYSPFQVHIHGLPGRMMTREVAEAIGTRLGSGVQFDQTQLKSMWGSKMRVKVSLDVRKPLKRVLRVRSPEREEVMVSFTYEKLPTFCYACGILGHIIRDCSARLEALDRGEDEGEPQYGPWLRENRGVGQLARVGEGVWGWYTGEGNAGGGNQHSQQSGGKRGPDMRQNCE
ncbi:UNVERIFIED_CONTAM: hypothetical protein Sradi_3011900 [Sesamum radiatum]|uniref:CCHC-type domain-containing protein n=1 Tax=Sesamum radiatum TaxID=300843 RepID=A0AAW2S362_SESRA